MESDELGDYVKTKELLGKGSFSTVYKGYHKESGREVAIKEVDRQKMNSKQALQEREIKVMQSLRHENIVELLDVIVNKEEKEKNSRNPYLFLVFEFCSGGEFAEYLRSQPLRKLSEQKTRHWMTHLRNGLYFLWKQKILHRDLKPQNLLLSSRDEQTAVLKVADFGFARFVHNQSMLDTVCGSPLYMAPEVLRQEKYADTADLWSVGCIMYQCLVGKAPYVAKNPFELLKKLASEELDMPKDVRMQISSECYDLIAKLLDKNRDTRISWEKYFGHRWFGGPPMTQSRVEGSSNSSNSSSSCNSGPSTTFGMDAGESGPCFSESPSQDAAGLLMGKVEAVNKLQRVADRSLAVLELADMKMDHSKPEEACILYWKGLELLQNAIAVIKDDADGVAVEGMLERLKLKLRVYQGRTQRLCVSRRLMVRSMSQLKTPSEVLLDFALQMGRDGGVSEILKDYAKAEKLYSNGAIILEQLYTMTPQDSGDRMLLLDALQKFALRIQHVSALESFADD